MNSADVDLLILGGGCAGLSLASRLARSNRSRLKVKVLEARTNYSNDRSWCFWSSHQHDFTHAVARRWSAWRFSSVRGEHVQHASGDISYQYVPAIAFYESTQTAIAQNPDIELQLATRVGSSTIAKERVTFETSEGSISARWVIDTRPDPYGSWGEFAQYFVGAEVETDEDMFDPAVVGLMQDMSCDERGFRFTYLLPFSARRALVEETRFCPTADEEVLNAGLQRSLAHLTKGAGFRVLRCERGRIPMAVKQPEAGSELVWRAGTIGGAVRPSTGYAFARIQQWADICAKRLCAGFPPVAHPAEPAWRAAADSLFLRVLETSPTLAPKLFMAMARGVAPRTLVRFLSDQGRLRDFGRVVAALPKWPFLAELASSKLSRSRA